MGEKLFIYRYKNKNPNIRERKGGALKWTFLSIILFFIVLALLPVFKKKKEPEKNRVVFELPGKNVLIKKVPLPETMLSRSKGGKKGSGAFNEPVTTSREKRLKELYGKPTKPAKNRSIEKRSNDKVGDKHVSFSQVSPSESKSRQIVPSRKKSELVYVVQVGAFKKEKNALALMEKLKKKGYQVFLTPQRREGLGLMYRVALDPVKSRSEAEKLKEKLVKEEGLGGAYIKSEKR